MEASLRKVLISVLSVLLLAFLVGCQESDSDDSSGDSSSNSAEQQQALEEAQREITEAKQEAEQARQDAEEAREEAEEASEPDAGGGSGEDGSTGAASEEPSENTPELSPSETLGAQYDYMGSGQYDEAYYMLAEQSQRLVPLEQYVGFFPSSYEISEYSVNSEQINGDIATVQADLVVSDSQRGVQQYPITQEFVLVEDEWRVILRDEQVETFTAVQQPEQTPPDNEPSGEPAVAGSDVVVRVTGSGVFSGNYGTLETSRSVDGVAPAEYAVEDLDTDAFSFDSVTAVMQKTGAGTNELGVQIIVDGEVVQESYTSAEYGVAQVSWSPSG
jgi:hypothetical protein